MSNNDCFYAWKTQYTGSGYATNLFPVCSGANSATGTSGTCVSGSVTAAITSPAEPVANGCSSQYPCSAGSSCYTTTCPAHGICTSSVGCTCNSNSDCSGAFSMSLSTPVCNTGAGKCVPAGPSPSSSPSRAPANGGGGGGGGSSPTGNSKAGAKPGAPFAL